MMNWTKKSGMLAAVAAGAVLLGACGTSAPAVGPVELSSTAGSGSGSGGAISSQPLPSGSQQPDAGFTGVDGEYVVDAGGAATITYAVAGAQLTVVDVAVNEGWRLIKDEREFNEAEQGFLRGSERVEVSAEIDDVRFETDIDIDAPAAPARLTYPVADAGTVVVDVTPAGVALVSQQAAPGWVATVDEAELAQGEVKVYFRNDGAGRSVDYDAEVDDGQLNVDIDSRTGANHFVRPPGR